MTSSILIATPAVIQHCGPRDPRSRSRARSLTDWVVSRLCLDDGASIAQDGLLERGEAPPQMEYDSPAADPAAHCPDHRSLTIPASSTAVIPV
ncbi:hypothetical protein [Ruania alba]|uniref:hypothetical protein n=1 Tax=Ruania alba TaxID=648782 RepID=UPI001113E67E|nr:hypothetical protein [Ruania alba]